MKGIHTGSDKPAGISQDRHVEIFSTAKLSTENTTWSFSLSLFFSSSFTRTTFFNSIHPRVNSVNRGGCLNFHTAPPFRSPRQLTCEEIYVPKEYSRGSSFSFFPSCIRDVLLPSFHIPVPFYHHILSYFLHEAC